MKFFLTIYLCSQVAQTCMIPPGYPKITTDYYSCVKQGLEGTYEILFENEFMDPEVIVANKIYPQFKCEKYIVPPKKPGTGV